MDGSLVIELALAAVPLTAEVFLAAAFLVAGELLEAEALSGLSVLMFGALGDKEVVQDQPSSNSAQA